MMFLIGYYGTFDDEDAEVIIADPWIPPMEIFVDDVLLMTR